VIRAERVGNVFTRYLNGQRWVTHDSTTNPGVVARGSGIGIAVFIRPGAVHNKFGFRCGIMGTF
jgi:hypothetical protein